MGRYGCSGKNRGRGTFRLTGALVAVGRILACCVLATPALGQSPSTDRIPSTLNVEPSVVYRTDPGTCVLLFKVFAEKSSVPIDRQALLKLVNLKDQRVVWQTTEENSQGAFTNVPFGNYDVEISAVGYLSTHHAAQTSNAQLQQFEIVLPARSRRHQPRRGRSRPALQSAQRNETWRLRAQVPQLKGCGETPR